MADSEENKNILKKIFLSSTIRNSKGKATVIPNTAQNLYLNSNTVSKVKKSNNIQTSKSQNGGTLNTNTSTIKLTNRPTNKSTIKPINTKSDSDSESDSDSDSELSESESEQEDIDPNDEPEDEYEKIDEETVEIDPNDDNVSVSSSDTENSNDVETEIEVADTEYNEDGINEKDTETNNEDIDDCLYQYDDLVEEKDSERQSFEIPSNERTTDNQITHYEKVRILGIRSKQIAMGAKVMIKYDNDMSAVELAKYELSNKTTPLIIKRSLPDNTYEMWKISELNIDDDDTNELIKNLNFQYQNKSNKYEFA
jgi:DNA-directed RNA polymerase I, II, and III subunit RPABC2